MALVNLGIKQKSTRHPIIIEFCWAYLCLIHSDEVLCFQ